MPAPRAQQQLPGQSHSCPLLTRAETLGVTLGCPLATCLIHKEIELALSNTYPDSRLPLFAATAPTAWPRSRQPGPLPDPALPAPPTSPQSCVVDSGIVPSQSPPPAPHIQADCAQPRAPSTFSCFPKVLSSRTQCACHSSPMQRRSLFCPLLCPSHRDKFLPGSRRRVKWTQLPLLPGLLPRHRRWCVSRLLLRPKYKTCLPLSVQ